jgi:hypothetical protein
MLCACQNYDGRSRLPHPLELGNDAGGAARKERDNKVSEVFLMPFQPAEN